MSGPEPTWAQIEDTPLLSASLSFFVCVSPLNLLFLVSPPPYFCLCVPPPLFPLPFCLLCLCPVSHYFNPIYKRACIHCASLSTARSKSHMKAGTNKMSETYLKADDPSISLFSHFELRRCTTGCAVTQCQTRQPYVNTALGSDLRSIVPLLCIVVVKIYVLWGEIA